MNTRILYDSSKTMESLSELKKENKAFAEGNRKISAEFNSIISDVSGTTINVYRETVNEYMDLAKMAEKHIYFLIRLIEEIDRGVRFADDKSRNHIENMR